MQRLPVNNLRLGLFIALVVLAPLSKFPYVAMPAFNFTSFRFGLYQLLAVLFVILCIVPVIKAAKMLYNQNKTVFISLTILGLVNLVGIFGSYYKFRSLLLIASVILLILLVLCAWWYVSTMTSAKSITRYLLYAAVIFGLLGIVQFIVATFSTTSLSLLCTGCGNQVFGFPRINLFAAEPQFYANALLPLFFVATAVFYKHKTQLSAWALVLTSIAIGLTFSRGAFIAVVAGLAMLLFVLVIGKILNLKQIVLSFAVITVSVLGSFMLLVASASYSFNDTPNITYNTVRTMLSQLSGGIITIPAKTVVMLAPANPNAIPSQPTANSNVPVIVATVMPAPVEQKAPIASDVVEESGNDRVVAARLALQAWRDTLKTAIVGVGAGNLGPYVVANINPNVPNNLTVYIFYVLVLTELGILGLTALLVLFGATFYALHKAYWNNNKNLQYLVPAVILFAFLVQYLFFGSYINVVYIWLWLGIGLGLASVPLKKGYN